MKTLRQQLTALLIKAAILLAFYALLAWWMLEKNIASTLFAAGPHVGLFKMLIAVLFLVMRAVILVYLPGLLLARVGLIVWDRLTAGTEANGRRE